MVRLPRQTRKHRKLPQRHDPRPRSLRSARFRADEHARLPEHHGVMEGASVKQRLSDAYLPGYQKNLMIWPWIQFTNFKYVPAEMRVLVVNIVSLGTLNTEEGREGEKMSLG
jgi:hypothetical protein